MQLNLSEQIDAFLNSNDARKHRGMAALLGEMGRDAVRYLPRLFEVVRECHSRIPHEDIRTVQVVAWGSRSMGTLVHCEGYTPGFHDSVLSWLLELTENPNPLLAEFAVWGLGDFGVPPDTVRKRLFEIASGPLRPVEPEQATIRSAAFRMLARISRNDAEGLRDSPAAVEYINSVEVWIQELVASGREGNWAHVKHIEESAWLRIKPTP